jgi:hypothetical protein
MEGRTGIEPAWDACKGPSARQRPGPARLGGGPLDVGSLLPGGSGTCLTHLADAYKTAPGHIRPQRDASYHLLIQVSLDKVYPFQLGLRGNANEHLPCRT